MADNVQLNVQTTAGQIFTTDNWATDPAGASQLPLGKNVFGRRDTEYVVVSNHAGERYPVVSQPLSATTTDHSGTTSGTPNSDTVAATLDANRAGLMFFALATNANTIWVNFGAAATAGSGSFPVAPGTYLPIPSGFAITDAVHVLSLTASQGYSLKTFGG